MKIKYIVLFLFISILSQTSVCQSWNGKKLKFNETTFSFGTFHSYEVVKHEFKFKNVSKQRIVIVRASASCGCTVADYSEEAIGPGEWGHVKVTYNGKGKEPGYFKKGVNILTNKEIVRLEITGTMLAK